MKKIIVFTWIFLVFPNLGKNAVAEIEVRLKILNIDHQNSGKVVVAVYDEKNFLKKMLHQQFLDANDKERTTVIKLPAGKYCFSVYQDTNQNQKLDRNFIGIPKEPIAFSNEYKPFGPPKFKGCAISVEKPMQLELKMEKVF